MTVSPEIPKLTDCEEEGKKVLTEPHLTFVKMGFGYSLMVLIGEGFKTDGASVPKKLFSDEKYGTQIQKMLQQKYPLLGTRWDFENLWEYLVGTPWDMPRLLAAIVHDALYDCKWKFRWLCDTIYRKILLQFDYYRMRADIEYACIRLAGWRNWNSITKKERKEARKKVKIEFVRNKKVKKIIKRIQRQEAEKKS